MPAGSKGDWSCDLFQLWHTKHTTHCVHRCHSRPALPSTRLHPPAPREVQQLVLRDRQRLARRDAQHVLHQVLPRDGLCDGVLHLLEGGVGRDRKEREILPGR